MGVGTPQWQHQGPTPPPKQAHLAIHPGGAHELGAPTGSSDQLLTPPVVHKLGASKTDRQNHTARTVKIF